VAEVGELVGRPPLAGACRIAIDATGVGRAVTDIFRDAGHRTQAQSYGVAPGTVVAPDLAMDMSRQATVSPPTIAAPIHAITITGGDQVTRDGRDTRVPKRDLVGVVQALLQTGRLRIAPDMPLTSVLLAELQNFKATISAAGHDSYGAGADWRAGNNDDLVLAVALAAWDAQNGTAVFARSY
jgi:chitodextrinase